MIKYCMQDGYQPIHMAAMYGQVSILRVLTSKYDIDPQIPGYVCHVCACMNVQRLCTFVSLITYMQDGSQPVHIAANHGHTDFVRVLIEEYHIDPQLKEVMVSNIKQYADVTDVPIISDTCASYMDSQCDIEIDDCMHVSCP